jgi:hypothetical protein
MAHRHIYRVCAIVFAFTVIVGTFFAHPARAQSSDDCKDPICWQIENRFRLFKDKTNFQLHEQAWAATSADGHSVLAMERWLNGRPQSPHGGWAEAMVENLCFVEHLNATPHRCERDGVLEDYVDPKSFAILLSAGPSPDVTATCEWTANPPLIGRAGKPVDKIVGCKDAPARIGRGDTALTLTLRKSDGTTQTKAATITPRDILVVGMGDSFTSGDGNPDKPVRLEVHRSENGMCFRRILTGAQFYLPTRDVTGLNMDCTAEPTPVSDPQWLKKNARWLYAPCHRSLYSHQMRAAMALSLEDAHRTVTYIPLGCTGGEIKAGLLGRQDSREVLLRSNLKAATKVQPQISNLKSQLTAAHARPDLLFLTVGGNDVGFSALVADLVVTAEPERKILSSFRESVKQARDKFPKLVTDFATLRTKLKPIMGGDLSKIVYVPYGNPLMKAPDVPCDATLRGFDGHPALSLPGPAAKTLSDFVEGDLTPLLQKLAQCAPDGKCADPAKDRMQFAAAHQPAFKEHGVCAVAGAGEPIKEPDFDADCFRDGGTFKRDIAHPFAHCDRAPAEWRPYAARKRWTRTPNDSFLTAMTYADSLPAAFKANGINDAIWGFSSVVYGGAAHPTAEGHAAMADAALIEARKILASPAPAAGR